MPQTRPPLRRQLSEPELLELLPVNSRSIARDLFALGRRHHGFGRGRHSSISMRVLLPSVSLNPVTLFVVSAKRGGEFYTYWLGHWPSRYKLIGLRYAARLKALLGPSVVGPTGARHVPLAAVLPRLAQVEAAVRDVVTGIARRGHRALSTAALDEAVSALEGQERKRMIRHRKRELRLRTAKVAQVLQQTGGPLPCDVAACGFDYAERYGALGKGYVQVHHVRPLGDQTAPSLTRLEDLRIVCANCHTMIHKGGECRSLAQISVAIRGARRIRRN